MIAPYPNYREWPGSWLPQVPSHWRTGALRHFISFNTGWTPPTQDNASYNGRHKWANISDLGSRTLMDTAKHLSDTAVAGRSPVPKGALLFSFKLSVGAVSRAGAEMFTNEAIAAFCGSDEVNLGYAYYAFPEFIPRNANTNIYGAQLLNGSLIRQAPLALPPVREQRAIADYLNRETAKIDTLIEEQQRLIETLRERRSAVITRAATRGIGDSSLRDSGNVYLGDVPRHWAVSRFSREMTVNGGQVDPRDEPWADMVLVAPNHIESGTGRIIGRESARDQGADSGKYVARAGQILYSKIRPALNKVAVAQEDCLCSADMYALSSLKADDVRYLTYYMLARPFHTFVSLTSMRVKMPKINRDELGEAPWLRPPLDEQRAIADYIDEQTRKIGELIVEAERFIELSRERRAALITAAVTGQIDVRDQVGEGTA